MPDPAENPPTLPYAAPTEPPTQASATLTAGSPPESLPTIPGFEIRGLLGRGGMGAVYRARQLSLNREVAVKMILAGPAGAAELSRFRREAEGIARLRHPNIVQIYEVGQANGQPYLVLELVEGGSLKDHLGDTPQPAAEAAKLIATLARAVHAAHLAGVVHRDLKPANILLTNDHFGMRNVDSGPTAQAPGSTVKSPRDSATRNPRSAFQPKVSDFGLAKFLGDESGQTRTGDILGTPGYMAPEQASGRGKEIGPATDVWALGVILYEALTGSRPFRARDMDVLLAMIRTEDPVPPGRVTPGIPHDLETICLKCLRKEPSKRYASAEALADDLDRFLAGRPILARPVGAVERAWKWVRRNSALAAAGATAVAATIALIVGLSVAYARVSAEVAERGKALEEKTKAEQDASREAREKGRALEEKTRAEATAVAEAEAKAKALGEALDRQVELNAGNAQQAIANGDTLAAARSTLEVLKLVEGNDPDRAARERVRLGMLLRRGPKLAQAWTSEKPVRAAAFSPDGGLVAVVGDDGYLRLFDAETGEPSGVPLMHMPGLLPTPVPARDVVFTPDGKTILTAAEGQGIFVWDVARRQRVAVLTSRAVTRKEELTAQFGRNLAPKDADALFERVSRSAVHPTHLVLSRDGSRLLAADPIGDHQVWDVAARKPLTPPLTHDRGLWHSWPAISPDGLRVAATLPMKPDRSGQPGLPAGGEQNRVVITLIDRLRSTGPLLFADGPENPPAQLTFTPDGLTLIALGDSASAPTKAWSAADGRESRRADGRLAYNRWPAAGIAFSADGRFEMHVGHLGLRVFHTGSGLEAFYVREAFLTHGTEPVFSPDGLLVAVAQFGGTVHVYPRGVTAGPGATIQLRHPAEVTGLAFAPDGRRVLTVCQDRTVRVWDLAGTDAAPDRLPDSEGLMGMIAYSPDGRYLASAKGPVTVYDPRTLAPVCRVARGGLRLFTAAFSRDGRRLLASSGMLGLTTTWSGSDDNIGCLVWDVEANRRVGEPIRAPAAGEKSVRHFAAALSPDGRRVAWSADGGPVRVIEIDTGRPAVPAPIPLPGGGEIDGLAFSPDGTRLAVKANTLRVFDAATGEPVGPPLDLPGTLGRVTFGPDGRTVAACSSGTLTGIDAALRLLEAGGTSFGARDPDRFRREADALARVWDAASGRPLTPALTAPGTVMALALRPPAGDHLLRADLDGSVRAWDVASGQAAFPGKRHPTPVTHAAYSPDGRWIGYAAQGGPAFLIEAATGSLLAPPMIDRDLGSGAWVGFRPDARQFAVGTEGGILFWDLTPELRPVPAIEQLLGVLTGKAPPAAAQLARPDRAAILAWHRARYAELRATGEPPPNALPHLDVLLAESPGDAKLRVARAECHVARRDWAAALTDLDAADGGKGTDPMSLFLRGRVYFERGETRKALAAFDDAAELSSGLWQARLYRGKAKLALGDWAGADKDMANAFASDNALPIPDVCAITLLRLVTGRTEPHSYQQMCDALYRGRGTTPDPDDLAVMAATFACGPTTSLKPDDVATVAARAVQFNPSRPDYRFAFGLALFRAGKAAEALTNLKFAEKTDATAVRLKARLALALAAPEEEAKQWLEKARADIKSAEAELAAGRSLPGTAWVEVEVLRRQAEARFKQ